MSHFRNNYPRALVKALLLTLSLTTALFKPAFAAEQLVISYGALQRSIPVSAVRSYIEAGEITPQLQPYLNLLSSIELNELRTSLQGGVKLGVVPVDNFLHSTLGQALLLQIGEVIRVDATQTGEQATAAALVLAAGKPDGITLVNFLETFPTSTVFVDGLKLESVNNQLKDLVNQAREVGLATDPKQPIFRPPLGLTNPARPGKYTLQKLTLTYKQRPLSTDIYLTSAKGPRPVVIISHGLGENRLTYEYLARQWASQGFQVWIPEHLGSNTQQIAAIVAGQVKEVVAADEFNQRPQDISTLIDRMSALQKTDKRFKNRFNLAHIGVFGHSFGGYTALALAGAPLDSPYLKQICAKPPTGLTALDLAFIFQCQAQDSNPEIKNLGDARVKSIIVSSPTASIVFGLTGLQKIKIPSLVVLATDDLVTPAVLEQIKLWEKLPIPTYRLTVVGGTHFSVQSRQPDANVPEIGATDTSAQTNLQAVSTVFWQVYGGGNRKYQAYLVPSYAQYLSKSGGLPVRLVAKTSVLSTALK